MAKISVRALAEEKLSKTGDLSLKRDVLGVRRDDFPQTRSLKKRLEAFEAGPGVRLAVVLLEGLRDPRPQRDVDLAGEILERDAGVWIDFVACETVDRPDLLYLDQRSCPLGVQNDPTDEELELFDIGREHGAEIVAYYIKSSVGGLVGCSAYPEGRRGFWVGENARQYTFAHELVHVLGLNPHEEDDENLMFVPTTSIVRLPPDLNGAQRRRIRDDAARDSAEPEPF